MTDNKQKYFLEVQLNYEAEVYDGDPTDLTELEELETYSIKRELEAYIRDFFPGEVSSVYIKASAVRKV